MIRHVFIGYDSREPAAFDLAEATLQRRASVPVMVTSLNLARLMRAKIMERPVRIRHGSLWDYMSDAPQSTEFACTRFLAPLLGRGWVLFCDCDVIFLADVEELFALADPAYAVMVVKHAELNLAAGATKMDNQPNLAYGRKNWSSVMLFNCEHPANERLTLDMINIRPGRELHGFCWLEDEEIGTLPPEWNWLVGVEDKPACPKLAHFTLGGPWLPGWKASEHDSIWLDAATDCRPADRAGYPGAGESAVPR
jgi:hypothetical protein